MMHNYEFKILLAASPEIDAVSLTTPDRALSPRALYQDVAERLRERIFSRELEPGSWIDEQKLAADFGISRTPMREALKVLAVEGLVTMKVRRGAYVTEMSVQDVKQVYHVLALLESDAAGEVARHASSTQIAQLRALHERLEREVHQREFFFATNEAFHLQLLSVAGNRWSLQLATDLRKVMKLNRQGSLLKSGRIEQALAEHRAILDALLARKPELAAQRMREHFASGLQAAA